MSSPIADEADLPEGSSGNEAIRAAAERAERTRDANMPGWPDLPVPNDTANLRLGPELNDALLGLLPLVGVWRGEGEVVYPTIDGPFHFGQQITVAHDGRPFLSWEARVLDPRRTGRRRRPARRARGRLVARAGGRHDRAPARPPHRDHRALLRREPHADLVGAADRRDRPHLQRRRRSTARRGSTASSTTATSPTSRSAPWRASRCSRTRPPGCSASSAELRPPVDVRPVGPEALLVDLDGLEAVDAVGAALRDALTRGELPGVVDVVPAARTVLVTAPGRARGPARGAGRCSTAIDTTAGPARDRDAGSVELPVHYDGEDLELVARDAGCSVDEVVALHTGATLTVAFGGFAPGFAYLAGLPEALQQPRLDTPRPRIPAGSVGVAGEFGGVYPRTSPGGWRLLGRLTDDAPTLFEPDRDPPALLVPGTTVRFRDAGRA